MEVRASTSVIAETLKNSISNRSNTANEQPVATAKLDSTQGIPATAGNTPSVVYHGADEAKPVVFSKSDKIELYRSISEGDHEQRYQALAAAIRTAGQLDEKMKPFYADFKEQLASTHPDLADKKFGISVDADGSLAILNNKGDLSDEQQETLTGFINSFDGATTLSRLANEFAEATVLAVETERGRDNASGWIGKFDVTKENFSEIIDFSPMLESGHSNTITSMFNQIYDKAEVKYDKVQHEQFVDGEWIKV